MVDIALDPNMYYPSMSTAQTLYKAADLGFRFIEMSPNAEVHFWKKYPKADKDVIADINRAQRDSGAKVRTLNPVYNWSSTDEQERAAQVRAFRRLLEIAIALACEPRVLLLDEPVAGVPAGERDELLETVGALPADVSVLLIEHDMDLVFSFADRMTVLVNGTVLTEGTPEEIEHNEDVKAVYLGHGDEIVDG